MLQATWHIVSKNFTRLIILVILIYIIWLFSTYNSKLYALRSERKDMSYLNHRNMKYILQWTRRFSAPFDFMGEGNSAFVKNKCKFTNCYVTDNSWHFLNHSDFDAIAFNGRDVIHLWPFQMPKNRTPRQKYIFGAMESPDNFPACDENLDGFFNWTWTYKLDSDFRWGYITIYDLKGNVVGPAIDMKWKNDMEPISEALKVELSSKSKAAAWFVSHCSTKSGREFFVKEVQKELSPYGWTVDVYGACGQFQCPRSKKDSCFELVEKDYYFYFSLENSFSEDYVTEKLLTALQHSAIPVVYGAANYSRFLPPGSYLDGRDLGPKELARRMSEIIGNQSMYYDYFRWRNHYVYRETSDNDDICKLCEMMNDDAKLSETSVWKDFRKWWNGARYDYNCKK
ncbi:alpha-(1,3)-fucosyltransferase C-like isoform X2 [Nymphalis io]|uniref:alpha-(1,3)-fucosyltransferase C-like isoform X2 n=1 Tax=Inachis io TaxID=171585 RepID=UPI002168B62F|nr:alpha-(1,3)-fucosyltransferase C-like isoform X2 [Nymphalis io]